MRRSEITPDIVREMLDYDQETGLFFWRVFVKGGRGKGKLAGNTRSDGYVIIRLLKRPFLAHRLAWAWVHGGWPDDMIDHIDRDPSNNRISNLRVATRAQNMANAKMPRRNRTSLKGVTYSAKDKRWFGRLQSGANSFSSGYMNCPAAAHFWYVVEADKHFGSFARAA